MIPNTPSTVCQCSFFQDVFVGLPNPHPHIVSVCRSTTSLPQDTLPTTRFAVPNTGHWQASFFAMSSCSSSVVSRVFHLQESTQYWNRCLRHQTLEMWALASFSASLVCLVNITFPRPLRRWCAWHKVVQPQRRGVVDTADQCRSLFSVW